MGARLPKTALKATIVRSLADRVIAFIETYCVYPEGPLVGRAIVLPEFHKRAIRGIYAESSPSVLKHRMAIISWPRKSSKSGVCACLLLAHLCGPLVVKNSQLYSAAMSRDQAAILFRYASKMVGMSAPLAERVRIISSTKMLTCPKHGTTYKALSADAKVSFGLSPQVIFFDELGQAGAQNDLWDALISARGSVFNAVCCVLSTQAADDTALLSTLIDDAADDPDVFVDLVQCPPTIDPLDATRLHEWLPAWNEAWCNTAEIIAQCQRAARLPSERARFLNLIANRRVRAVAGLVTRDIWDANGGAFDWELARGRAAWAGLDLSKTTDLTAFVIVVPMEDKTFAVLARFWLPQDGIEERERGDKVPYREWAENGFITLVPGKVISYEWVCDQIMLDAQTLDIREIAFDRWRIKDLRKSAADAGVDLPPLVEFGQGYQSMGPAVQHLEDALLREELRHGMQPVLRWNMANAVVAMDPAGNRKFDKSKQRLRIDGAVALCMAVGQYRKSESLVDVASWIG